MNKRLFAKVPIVDANEQIVSTAKRFEGKNIQYLVLGKTIKIENKKTLLLHFFPRCELVKENIKAEFRTFITCDDYITQRLDSQSIRWMTGAFENIIPYDYSYSYRGWKSKLYLFNDETVIAIQEIVGTDKRPLESLENHQTSIQLKRLEKKHKLITDRIDKKMQLIPKIPVDFEEWIDKTAFAKNRYIFYRYKKGKTQKGYCTVCCQDIELANPRHRQDGLCPKCNSHVTYMVEGKSKSVFDKIHVTLMQKISTGFIVRYFAIHRKYPSFSKPVFSIFEESRDFYEENKCEMFLYGNFKQTGNIRWCENPKYLGAAKTVVYEKTITEAIRGSRYQYCAIEEFATREKGAFVNVYGYLLMYEEKPFIEYLTKLGLYELVKNLTRGYPISELNNKGSDLTKILGVNKKYIKILREIDASPNELGIVQEFSKLDSPVTAELIMHLQNVFENHAESVVRYSKYVSLPRIEHYCSKRVDKQNTIIDVFITWRDYIISCKKLQYDLTNDFILFPKHLKKAHDIAYQRVEAQEHAERTKKLGVMSKKLVNYFMEMDSIYSYEADSLMIIAPRNLNEIVTEGHKLRHCVGGYAESVGEGKTIILFIRMKSDIKKPFYTVEVKNNRIVQCRGMKNCAMTDAVRDFIKDYKKNVLLKMERKAA
jgi:hypothetical protein